MTEQRLRRALHRLQVVALLGAERRVERELGHADDAVHRRADLVAHVREELALGPVGGLGRVLRLARAPRSPRSRSDLKRLQVRGHLVEDCARARRTRRVDRAQSSCSSRRPRSDRAALEHAQRPGDGMNDRDGAARMKSAQPRRPATLMLMARVSRIAVEALASPRRCRRLTIALSTIGRERALRIGNARPSRPVAADRSGCLKLITVMRSVRCSARFLRGSQPVEFHGTTRVIARLRFVKLLRRPRSRFFVAYVPGLRSGPRSASSQVDVCRRRDDAESGEPDRLQLLDDRHRIARGSRVAMLRTRRPLRREVARRTSRRTRLTIARKARSAGSDSHRENRAQCAASIPAARRPKRVKCEEIVRRARMQSVRSCGSSAHVRGEAGPHRCRVGSVRLQADLPAPAASGSAASRAPRRDRRRGCRRRAAIGITDASVFSAMRSFGSLNVGTRTTPLAM